jgi:hypothetical protein
LSKALRVVPPSACPAVAAAIVTFFVIRSSSPRDLASNQRLAPRPCASGKKFSTSLYRPVEPTQGKSALATPRGALVADAGAAATAWRLPNGGLSDGERGRRPSTAADRARRRQRTRRASRAVGRRRRRTSSVGGRAVGRRAGGRAVTATPVGDLARRRRRGRPTSGGAPPGARGGVATRGSVVDGVARRVAASPWRSERCLEAAERASRQRFFLAMAKNGPYSESVFACGEKYFRRVHGDESTRRRRGAVDGRIG